MGTWLMSSMPQATATSTTPLATRLLARLVACWDEPHWLSTVVAGVVMGRPAVSQLVRATLNDCMPTWLTQPPTTWPTSTGSMPDRCTSSASTLPNRSAEWMVDSPPPRRPIGERTASTMTTSLIGPAYDDSPNAEKTADPHRGDDRTGDGRCGDDPRRRRDAGPTPAHAAGWWRCEPSGSSALGGS